MKNHTFNGTDTIPVFEIFLTFRPTRSKPSSEATSAIVQDSVMPYFAQDPFNTFCISTQHQRQYVKKYLTFCPFVNDNTSWRKINASASTRRAAVLENPGESSKGNSLYWGFVYNNPEIVYSQIESTHCLDLTFKQLSNFDQYMDDAVCARTK